MSYETFSLAISFLLYKAYTVLKMAFALVTACSDLAVAILSAVISFKDTTYESTLSGVKIWNSSRLPDESELLCGSCP
ncbi:uncharacterized protein EV420DRAFT_1750823, partial [Desarmillaria tabescens]